MSSTNFSFDLASENPHVKAEQDESSQNSDPVNEDDHDEEHEEATLRRRHLSGVNRHLRDATVFVFAEDADERRADVWREVAVTRPETSRPGRPLVVFVLVAAAERDASCPNLIIHSVKLGTFWNLYNGCFSAIFWNKSLRVKVEDSILDGIEFKHIPFKIEIKIAKNT